MTAAPADLLQTALAWHHAGYTPVPIHPNGQKRPIGTWAHLQNAQPDETYVRSVFRQDTDGIGLICGGPTHLEMLEVEARATHLTADLAQLLEDNGFGPLWTRITTGYVEASPSGGIHWYYRVSDGPARGNTKLAQRPATSAELVANPLDKVKVLIETRGQGGFTVIAPSAGRTHATGHAWTALHGTMATIPTITSEERDAVYAFANYLDQMPAQTPAPSTSTVPRRDGDPVRPGDDYNARATWDDILLPLGWTKTRRFGRTCQGWTRPGKVARDGISATTGRNDGDNLYVFSSSTVFETEKPYDKFGAYALLEHSGDFSAAAKALAALGFGDQGGESLPSLHELAGQPETPLAPTSTSVTVASSGSGYTETDDGNANRFVDTYQGLVRYCPQRSTWLTWDGNRWVWDDAGHTTELARDLARHLPTTDQEARRHRSKSLSRAGVNAFLGLARSDCRVIAHLGDLDARPYELNTPGGILDLRTATLHPADPDALHTRTTTVTPDFTSAPTRWLNFLADAFAGDEALTTYIQRLIGVSLIGVVLEQVLPFGFGSGANGKTTLIGVVQRVAGIGDGGYCISAPADLLLATSNQGHPTEIARLSGARMVVASELEDGQKFAEAKIKQLTGKDTITGRFIAQDWFSFTPTHTLWLLANHQPTVRAGGPAFWRRIRLVPFLHTVPAEQRIADLEDQLVTEEGPAILAWIAQGARDYLSSGIAEPSSVRVATDAYQADQDTVGRFVAEACDVGDPAAQHLRVRVVALRSAYETWCHLEGETPVGAKAFTLELRSRFGVLSERSPESRYYAGIRLNEVPDVSSEAGDASPHASSTLTHFEGLL